jgi:SAM-dependent methyltransferase
MRDRTLIITAFPDTRECRSSESAAESMLRTREDVYQIGFPAKPGEHYRAFVRFAAQHAGKSILDLGCGYGAYSLALAAEGRQCVGGDVNMNYLASASVSGLPVVAVDSVLPFPDRSFEHVPHLEGILKEAFRVARRNVLVTVPNSEDLDRLQQNDVTYGHMLSSDHLHFFNPASLEELLGRFGGKVEIRRGDPIYPFWFVSRSLAYYALRVLYRTGLLKPNYFTRLYAVASVREN